MKKSEAERAIIDEFNRSLNKAAKDKKIEIYGRKTFEIGRISYVQSGLKGEQIPEDYFTVDRDFDWEFNKIFLVPSYADAIKNENHRLYQAEQNSSPVPEWEDVCVARASYAAWNGDIKPILKSGMPGRPSSKLLVRQEFERRIEGECTEVNVTKESKYLEQWLEKTHPDQPPATEKTIRNNIGLRWLEFKIKQGLRRA